MMCSFLKRKFRTLELDALCSTQLVFVAAAVPRELPATMTRAVTALSPAMRRRIYEYCVEVSRSTGSSSRIADEDLTLLEDTRCT